MQLGQAEILSVVDDYRVDVGHVHAALDDGGGEEYVVVVVGEVDDGLLEFFRLHAAVGDGHACVGDEAVYHCLKLCQALDAVVDEENLSVAAELEVDGLGDEFVREGRDLCDDGVAVCRRRGYRRQVAGAHERELQCAGNGRGAHRQRVDVGL